MSLPLKEAIKIAENQLIDAGVSNAAYDAKELYKFFSGLDNAGFLMAYQSTLQDKLVEGYFALVDRRRNREPLQYIIGETDFMGLTFKVDSNVLIPRQDTETVVEEALKYAKGDVLDLCTGSGCIAVSIAKLSKDSKVTAVDISDEALKIAGENAKLNSAKVKFLKSDMFNGLKGTFGTKKFNLIVSNPPYIPKEVILGLEREVSEYEPKLALDGGDDGLDFYKRIANEAPNYLKKDGVLVLEIGDTQGLDVTNILKETGKFLDIQVKKDLGGLDRMVIAKYFEIKK